MTNQTCSPTYTSTSPSYHLNQSSPIWENSPKRSEVGSIDSDIIYQRRFNSREEGLTISLAYYQAEANYLKSEVFKLRQTLKEGSDCAMLRENKIDAQAYELQQ